MLKCKAFVSTSSSGLANELNCFMKENGIGESRFVSVQYDASPGVAGIAEIIAGEYSALLVYRECE